MHRRSLLTALASLGLVGIARTARADLAVGPPPPRLAVRPEPNTFQGTPASVTLHVQNPTADAVDIQGIRLLITDAGIRFPLHIALHGCKPPLSNTAWDELPCARSGLLDKRPGSIRITFKFP